MTQDRQTSLDGHARRRACRRLAGLVLIGCVAMGLVLVVKYGRYHVLPRRFAVVEPGKLYRSGYCEPWPLKRMIEEHGIRTILVLLNHEPDSSEQQAEKKVAAEEGVKLIRIGMPGDGCADFDLIEQAADLMAAPEHYPLLVHCAAGVNRTGAVCAAWRMKYCGWTWEQALDEAIARGYSPERNPELREHMRRFYQTRILTTRPATSPASRKGRSTQSSKRNSRPTMNSRRTSLQ